MMLRTVEAVIDEQGSVQLLEALVLSSKHRALVIILEDEFIRAAFPATMLRPFGLCAGEFTVPANFNEPLPDTVLAEFEGS